jgi:hypothetical protein
VTRIPPRDPAKRRRYYGLLGRAAKAQSLAQKAKLLTLARGLMERADGKPLAQLAHLKKPRGPPGF